MRLPWNVNQLPTYDEVRQFLFHRDSYIDWFKLVHDKEKIFQFWNKEYIQSLANKIKKLVTKCVVLEVCAGDGQLTHWLRECGINIRATDNFQRKLKPKSPVEHLEALKAIEKYHPTMVLASWIEYGSELDIKILETRVRFFILIGEGQCGATGSGRIWEEYKQIGYTLESLNEVDKYNICRTDYSFVDDIWRHSCTSLFKLVEE